MYFGDGNLTVSLQTTINNPIDCTGVGLHSGVRARVTLKPAAADTGIVFCRTDVNPAQAKIPAIYSLVSDTMLGTTVSNDSGVCVATIEHLMSAISGIGIDNLLIEIDGPEVPIMDGSAAPFVFLLDCAGICTLPKPRQLIRILEPTVISEDGKRTELHPYSGFKVDYEIDFDCSVIARQANSVEVTVESFRNEICQARTFGYLKDVEQLRALGLAQGGSLDNSIVIDGDVIMNEGGLRYSDEFVRHKVLDAIGDLCLAGAPILGRFVGVKAGHGMNNKLLRALFAAPHTWEYVMESDTGAKQRRRLMAEQATLTAVGAK